MNGGSNYRYEDMHSHCLTSGSITPYLVWNDIESKRSSHDVIHDLDWSISFSRVLKRRVQYYFTCPRSSRYSEKFPALIPNSTHATCTVEVSCNDVQYSDLLLLVFSVTRRTWVWYPEYWYLGTSTMVYYFNTASYL